MAGWSFASQEISKESILTDTPNTWLNVRKSAKLSLAFGCRLALMFVDCAS